jgi:PAS domain S-box-containing protein
MDTFYNPAPIDREIKVNPSLMLMIKINNEGTIEYVNHSFSEISGYEEYEIIGESFDLLHHPDMPKVIYQMLMEKLANKEHIRMVNKLLAKDGRYFWVFSEFETKIDAEGNPVAHYCHSFAAPSYAVHKIESLYKILNNIETKTKTIETSKRYLIGFLEERNLTYDQFIEELSVNRPELEEQVNVDYNVLKAQNMNRMSQQEQQFSYNNPNMVQPKVQQPIAPNQKKPKSLLKKVFGK